MVWANTCIKKLTMCLWVNFRMGKKKGMEKCFLETVKSIQAIGRIIKEKDMGNTSGINIIIMKDSGEMIWSGETESFLKMVKKLQAIFNKTNSFLQIMIMRIISMYLLIINKLMRKKTKLIKSIFKKIINIIIKIIQIPIVWWIDKNN